MKCEIITIGDEILIGQIVDTNSAWIARQLNSIGIFVYQITSVSDKREHILTSLAEASSRAELILVTGGLGPTKDDITKQTICDYFNSKLVLHEKTLSNIKLFLEKRGITKIIENNHNQAMVPDNCTVIENPIGTAPGMLFEKDNTYYVFMPGVPFEMKHIVEHGVVPFLENKFNLPKIIHKTVYVQGIPEALLAEMLTEWENNLPDNINLAYLPSPGIIRLRLTTSGKDSAFLQKQIQYEIDKLKKIIPDNLVSHDEKTIEKVIGELLVEKNKTLGTAESCTGGNIAHLITSVPGSSLYFKGSVVAYSNEIKSGLLNVPKEIIFEKGAVSKETVEQMAKNTLNIIGCDYSIAVSGIAGPDGGSVEKPVGTTWIAVASKNKVQSQMYIFGDNRERNIERASTTALNMLRNFILKE